MVWLVFGCLFSVFVGLLCALSCRVIVLFVVGVSLLFVVCYVAACCFIGLSCVYVLLLLFCFRGCFKVMV